MHKFSTMKDGLLKQFQDAIKVFNQLRKSSAEWLVLLRRALSARQVPSQIS